ncbi:MAG: lysyl oxidase family protein [Bacteroidia bacterium]
MIRLFTILLVFMSFSLSAQVTCGEGESQLIVQITPDQYPWEISWNVTVDGNIIAEGTTVGDTLCVETGSCVQVRIIDSYGDGIYLPGGYWIYLDGDLVANGNSFGSLAEHSVACPPGSACTEAIEIQTGSHTATFEDSWFRFDCNASGTYNFSTCDLSTCDTKIWVFESCPTVGLTEGPMGTYAFNDNADCGLQSNLDVVFVDGFSYLIRIGDNVDACEGNIDFSFSYTGPISGCTDPASCNYNPLAEVDNGSCIYFPDPACQGPDLAFDSLSFINSLALTTHTTSGCDIAEDCVTGYGTRYVIRFSSKIDNIGTADYYIGTPSANPDQFNVVNCHGHTHYEGYGDYRLYDMDDNIIPAGHKNGFCVMDLCGFGQYNCGNMGISAGCYDVYGAGTQCQWIDITDVPAGDYRIAVIINSQHRPDALGRNEINYLNNALQVCINITRNAANVPSFTLLPECEPFVDCDGIPGGVAIRDCNGDCAGDAMFGNTVEDEVINYEDVAEYINMLEVDNPAVMPCYDLNDDEILSVYDAALEMWCMQSAGETGDLSNCYFPRNVINPNDSTYLEIVDVNYSSNYLDIQLNSERANVVGYQFILGGIVIDDVAPLTNPTDMPIHLGFNAMRSEVFGLFPGDSIIQHGTSSVELVRVYFSSLTGEDICITEIIDIPNNIGEKTMTFVAGDCFIPNTVSFATIGERSHLTILPNPASDMAWVNIPSDFSGKGNWQLFDAMGRFVMNFNAQSSSMANQFSISLNGLSNGVYILRLEDDKGQTAIGRLVKQ